MFCLFLLRNNCVKSVVPNYDPWVTTTSQIIKLNIFSIFITFSIPQFNMKCSLPLLLNTHNPAYMNFRYFLSKSAPIIILCMFDVHTRGIIQFMFLYWLFNISRIYYIQYIYTTSNLYTALNWNDSCL